LRAVFRLRFIGLVAVLVVATFSSFIFAALLAQDTKIEDFYKRDLHKRDKGSALDLGLSSFLLKHFLRSF